MEAVPPGSQFIQKSSSLLAKVMLLPVTIPAFCPFQLVTPQACIKLGIFVFLHFLKCKIGLIRRASSKCKLASEFVTALGSWDRIWCLVSALCLGILCCG